MNYEAIYNIANRNVDGDALWVNDEAKNNLRRKNGNAFVTIYEITEVEN